MTSGKLVNCEQDERRSRILTVVANIPRGEAWSYAEVARQAGLPRGHRIVAKVMASLPSGSRLPWFRVLRADGRPAFAPDSDMARKQLAKLAAEGLSIRNGRVVRSAYPEPGHS